MTENKKVFIVMGVSGTGKTTVGKLLGKALDIPFFDGDDYHPETNVQKMSAGIPLNDQDREGWLLTLNELAQKHRSSGAVIACSALKESYRKILRKDLDNHLEFVFLQGSFELIKKRMESRKDHFMPAALLKSQFDTLEPPNDAITLSITNDPEMLVSQILRKRQ
ncbi:gluconokinase [Flagellimonas allohymeniacidonis]|uniref:Gluconokinase n=1 Tax=Flagellimonas allohymeniacidonis TaxID=2517819 RepID=A0A4Q8QLC3_9FLAO|nr:gluconokinase [Allomuricauda hymeniacidonis]TAI49056.1 gluconokinase [Allomuricauda hymeniacidonis]